MKQIKNLAYIHDLGGTKTSSGQRIKPHLLYRSAHLSEIDEKAVDRLANELNIKHVIDLRTDEEVSHRPEDSISSKISYKNIFFIFMKSYFYIEAFNSFTFSFWRTYSIITFHPTP